MIKNYLKIAWRHLSRNKVSSSINILGLAMAIAIAILIGLYIRHQLSYDNWYATNDKIFRVYRYWSTQNGGWVFTPDELATTLRNDIPEVVAATHISANEEMLLTIDSKKIYAKESVFVDSSFFETIPFPFLHGNPKDALLAPNSIVLSEKMAKKLVGDNNPIGMTIQLNGDEERIITGVIKKTGNTHLDKEVFARQNYPNYGWLSNSFATYIRFKDNIDEAEVSTKITSVVNPRLEQAFKSMGYQYGKDSFSDWKLQAISDVHLYSKDFTWAESSEMDSRYLYIFGAIALILLLIAVFNYMNLTTAQSSLRAKEIGIRKVTGAHQEQLIIQFLTEAIFQTSLAVFIGLVMASTLLPIFESIFQINISWSLANDWPHVIILFLGTIIIGLISGLYPAFVLSRFRPKRNLQNTKEKLGLFSLRKFLVVAQFTGVVTMLITLGIMSQQVDYMLNEDLGFKGDQVIVVPINENDSPNRIKRFRSELLKITGVQQLGLSSTVPGQRPADWSFFVKEETKTDTKEEAKTVGSKVIFADGDALATWDLEMLTGRNFSNEITGDTANFIVNEAFVRAHQIKDPLNTKMRIFADSVFRNIIGVVKDFHFQGLDKTIEPLAISGIYYRNEVSFKVSTNNLSTTINGIQKLWPNIEPNHPMRYSFLDENFAKQYQSQKRFRKGMMYATLLTIFIAMMGLFGLATFTTQNRIKEIGIRKVLGASVGQLVLQLNKDFIQLILIAFLIAIPLGWYFSNQWLQDFAYRIDMPWWVFIVAGLLTLGISFLTISFQSVKAAIANPVKSLRSE
ncbi:MAG TPA: ABC transporter permease [Saprospiraceae bacterium]|nr:ABC transporter permease [Saprospiraceae bacterium]